MTKEELSKLVHAQEGPDGPVTQARADALAAPPVSRA